MTTGKVYFIECAGRIKIGYTSDISGRLKGLSTGAPQALTVLATVDGTVSFERAIHKVAAGHRLKGEWFKDCPDIRSLMASILADGPSAIGFIEPKKDRSCTRRDESKPDPFVSPMRPVYRRIDACMDRYCGDRVSQAREREKLLGLSEGQLTNRVIGGTYSAPRLALAFHMVKHALGCMEGLLDTLNESLHDECPINQDDLVPRANYCVERLEQGLHRLFENPDPDVIDVGGYEGMSLRTEPQTVIASAATEFCHM